MMYAGFDAPYPFCSSVSRPSWPPDCGGSQDKRLISAIFRQYLALLQALLPESHSKIDDHGTSAVLESANDDEDVGADVATAAPPRTATGIGPRGQRSVLWKWRDAISRKDMETEDARGELICVLLNIGLWHCLHANKLGESGDDEDSKKETYRALRIASSYFSYVERDQIQLYPYSPNTDFDERIIKCLARQCLAEAQEVTVERARAKEHSDELIAGIAQSVPHSPGPKPYLSFCKATLNLI